jgi:hypothetical protein
MADSSGDGSVGSWPGLFDQINKTFNLVRDAFGYALPGGAFLAVGLVSGRFNLWQVRNLLAPYELPTWAAFVALVAICYPVGTVMAAFAYMPFMFFKNIYWFFTRHPSRTPVTPASPPELGDFSLSPPSLADAKTQDPPEGSWASWLLYHPTEVAPRTVQIRSQRPKFLDTLDRRETLTLLSASVSSALIFGWLAFFQLKLHFSTMIVVAGIVTYIQFFTGLAHLRRVTKAIYTADDTLSKAEAKAPKHGPDFAKLLADLVAAATDALNKID